MFNREKTTQLQTGVPIWNRPESGLLTNWHFWWCGDIDVHQTSSIKRHPEHLNLGQKRVKILEADP
ncbi:hypothetical protein C5Y93_10850 [Blastopirellula marina]|uniref:Uncharacterized protein n=1 Tax=Blastopirellula marina TaxID=124 RepID=A0A2S8GNR5_9BACT|nr:hypothetical protein C5Y93_10850 [Blastopirellula marina]